MKPLASVEPAQLKAYRVLQEIRMQWVALLGLGSLFGAALLACLVLVFVRPDSVTTYGMLVIEGVLGWSVKHMVKKLFHIPGKPWWHGMFGARRASWP